MGEGVLVRLIAEHGAIRTEEDTVYMVECKGVVLWLVLFSHMAFVEVSV